MRSEETVRQNGPQSRTSFVQWGYNNETTSHWAPASLYDVILSKISAMTIGCASADKSRKSGCDSRRRLADNMSLGFFTQCLRLRHKEWSFVVRGMFPPTTRWYYHIGHFITDNRKRLHELRNFWGTCSLLILYKKICIDCKLLSTHRCASLRLSPLKSRVFPLM